MKNKKKKLYFDGTPLVGKYLSGVGTVLLETLRALDTDYYYNRYDITIFLPYGEGKQIEKFRFKGLRTAELPYTHKFLSLFSRLRYGPPIDVILGRGIYVFENYRNWNLLFSKSITYVHDVVYLLHPEFVQPANLAYLKKYMPLWLKRADRVVTVSRSAQSDIEASLGLKDVSVILNAPNKSMSKRPASEVARVISNWQIPQDYFLYIGNIEPRKNLVNMIEGFTKYILRSKKAYALVMIGGGGWKNDEIFQAIEGARKSGVTIVLPDGYVPDEDMPAIVSGAKALLQLSWYEGYGLSVAQALACGTPVVASDISSLKEVSEGNEKNVVFVNPGSVKDISKAIESVAKIPKARRPELSTSWQKSVVSLLEVIGEL